MMAWRVHEFGPPVVMKFEEVPRPTPGSGEVLVRVEAAGVGPWDAWIRAGKSALPQPLPLTVGSDLSGEIVEVGQGVSDLRAGDQVYGVTNPRFIGAYAEFAVASAQTRSLQVLRRGGKLISAVSPPDQVIAKSHGVEAAFFLVNVTSRRLAQIAALLDGGELRTHVGAVLPLRDASEAHLMLEHLRPQPKGKIVLAVGAS